MDCRALEEARSLPVVTVRRRCNEICIDVQAATARCDPHVAIYMATVRQSKRGGKRRMGMWRTENNAGAGINCPAGSTIELLL